MPEIEAALGRASEQANGLRVFRNQSGKERWLKPVGDVRDEELVRLGHKACWLLLKALKSAAKKRQKSG